MITTQIYLIDICPISFRNKVYCWLRRDSLGYTSVLSQEIVRERDKDVQQKYVRRFWKIE